MQQNLLNKSIFKQGLSKEVWPFLAKRARDNSR